VNRNVYFVEAPQKSEVVLIVGEAPNRKGQGKRPNTTLTGGRIAKLHPRANTLPRTNILRQWPGAQGKGSAFPLGVARPAAARLWRRKPLRVSFLVIGTRAAAAFGIRRAEYEYLTWFEHRGRLVAVCPHPSGIVLWWNEQENRDRAVAFFRDLLGG
jgi:hypothetical protein